jgi:dethiobiotin synthetase
VTAAYFVTGTDTAVGKTTVAAGILAAVRRRGHAVSALKPAESGCPRAPSGHLIPEDAQLLREAAGLEDVALDTIAPNRYELAVAPGIAARGAGPPFSFDAVLEARAVVLRRQPRLLLVEGAGGLLVPYADDLLGADIAAKLQLPLLVVARASLGTINHTVLTVLEARRRDLRVAGVILNRVVAARLVDEDTNAREIERLADVPVLGTVPHIAIDRLRDPAALASAVDGAFDVMRLLR